MPTEAELVQAIRGVINRIIALNSDLMDHVVRGDAEKMDDLREQLAHARIRKDSLLESYKQHVRVHGCKTPILNPLVRQPRRDHCPRSCEVLP